MGNDAPERIWATGDGVNGSWTHVEPTREWESGGIEYVRADLCAAQPAEAGRVEVRDLERDFFKMTPSEVLAALATPAPAAQEPVAWVWLAADGRVRSASNEAPDDNYIIAATADGDRIIPVYATPPAAPTDTALVEAANAVVNCLGELRPEHEFIIIPVAKVFGLSAALASRAAPPEAPGKGESCPACGALPCDQVNSPPYAPVIHAMFETVDESVPVTGNASVKVKRVEHHDDGSFTAIIDYWPDAPVKGEVTVEEAARVLLDAHEAARLKPVRNRSNAEMILANLGRNRLRALAGGRDDG